MLYNVYNINLFSIEMNNLNKTQAIKTSKSFQDKVRLSTKQK